MEIHAVNIAYDVCIMSALLLIAQVIRSRVRFIQKLYIPSALIAGFLGLLGGKYFLNILPFSTEIGNYAGILIAVLFGSMFLGNNESASFKKMIQNVGDTFMTNGATELAQFGLFTLIGVTILPVIFKGINAGFGLMLPAGFVGGHGTAAAIGSVFASGGWDEAASIGQTFATIGLLTGLILGVVYINIGARKGYTKVIENVRDLPEDMRTGLVPEEKRVPVGSATINSMAMDSITWHLLLVMTAVGGAYLLNYLLGLVIPQISIPVYGLALIVSVLLQQLLKALHLSPYVDKRIITHIGSTATDFLVGFGVASININVVVKYAVPIIILSLAAIALVSFNQFVLCRRLFHNYWFERGIYIFGMSTGVLATGVILLRICDPEFKTGVLEDFGFAWIFLSIMDMIVVSLAPMAVMSGAGLSFSLILIVISLILVAITWKLYGNPEYKKSKE